MKFTGERITWNDPASHIGDFKLITELYMQAMVEAVGKRVIDAAAGTGFGTFLLSLVAEEVFAIERDAEAVAEFDGKLPFKAPVRILPIDLEKEPVDITADLAVSIETIEHLENPEFFLANLKAKSLFFSIPCYGDKNEFHKAEYTEEKAKALVTKYFPILTYTMSRRRMIGLAHKPAI